jgi:hypothetical protein
VSFFAIRPIAVSRRALSIGFLLAAGLFAQIQTLTLIHFQLAFPPMWVNAIGIELPLLMTMTACSIPIWAKIIGPPCSAARVTQYAAVCTFSILCSDFGISFASQAMPSARIFSFRPSGN